MKIFNKKYLFLFCVFVFSQINAIKLGSNVNVFRATSPINFSKYQQNTIGGFTVVEAGFSLEDSDCYCTYDSFFPPSGSINFNGGHFMLSRDFNLANICSFQSMGSISGNGYLIDLTTSITCLQGDMVVNNRLNLISSKETLADVLTLDFSHNDKYVAVGFNSSNGVKVYSFLNGSLNEVASFALSKVVTSVRWSPAEYILAISTEAGSGDEIFTYEFDSLDNSFTQIDSKNFTDTVRGVAWNKAGTYLACVKQTSDSELIIYPMTAGVFGTGVTYDISGSRAVANKGVCWDFSGDYLAVCMAEDSGSATDLMIFYFDGAAITSTAGINIGADGGSLDWAPSGTYIAVGLSSGNNKLRIYEFDSVANSLTQACVYDVGTSAVNAVAWNPICCSLVIGQQFNKNYLELSLFNFDADNPTLSLVAQRKISADVGSVRWSNSNDYLVAGNSLSTKEEVSPAIAIYTSIPQYVFSNVHMRLSENLQLRNPIVFVGDCSFFGNGHILDLTETGSLIVWSNSKLTLDNIVVKNISDSNITCLDTGVLTLKDVNWNQIQDFNFDTGAIWFKNYVFFTGDYSFIYQSNQTSTVLHETKIELDAGFTFSYDPLSKAGNLFQLEDSSARLKFMGASLYAAVPLELTKGTLLFKEDSIFASSYDPEISSTLQGISFGNSNAEEDLIFRINPGVCLTVDSGILNYKNILPSSLKMPVSTSVIYMNDDTELVLTNTMNMQSGVLMLGDNLNLTFIDAAELIGSTHPLGTINYSFISSGEGK
ncbi:MAG: hypothetical protein UR26_C0006G0012 [candidate division TM6 bacterium GW2011_GWF2_32_72]|nr:MAG: hypothetical protein UR26_C0006G0012 [candidate division TM6 bacterium GW2011_GWF2_32_72]